MSDIHFDSVLCFHVHLFHLHVVLGHIQRIYHTRIKFFILVAWGGLLVNCKEKTISLWPHIRSANQGGTFYNHADPSSIYLSP